jgi:uncharacterized protein YlxW (UPF0749 family)
VSPETDPSPAAGSRRRGPWRLGTPLVGLACGALFVTSFANSEGTDLRPGRYTDLASVVEAENDEYEALEARVRELNGDVERLTGEVGTLGTRKLQSQVEEMRQPAGLTATAGPGITVTLSDAPAEVINSTTGSLRTLIVHQQDIQAVVNAMWAGGAEAVTIQGQRMVSTSGIKCEGNAVMLGGGVYPQPYVIKAIGDPVVLESAVLEDDYVELYRRDAALPEVSVGFEMLSEERIEMPAYDGLMARTYAEPIS